MENLKPGDIVVLTGKLWGIGKLSQFSVYKIKKIKYAEGENPEIWFENDDDDFWYICEEWEVQRIQDYLKPGDKYEATLSDGRIITKTVDRWEGSKVWDTDGKYTNVAPNDHPPVIKIRKLEEKMEETKKRNITELTLKDLYITAKKPACDSTAQSFVAKFGFEIGLHNPELKKWIKEKHLEKDFQDNLPDHYAVIFKPEWQHKVNELVFVENDPSSIGRVFDIRYGDTYGVNTTHGAMQWAGSSIKPIYERRFQVGDCIKNKQCFSTYHVTGVKDGLIEINNVEWISISRIRENYDLVVSPAIPGEVMESHIIDCIWKFSHSGKIFCDLNNGLCTEETCPKLEKQEVK